jgi:hypothetical protein
MQKFLNKLTESDYEQIKTLAQLFFSEKEICIMLEIDIKEFEIALLDKESAAYKSFVGGSLQGEFELRQCISKLANSGSSPAQTAMLEIKRKSKFKK